jgi:ATP/maltotriose-dependent transcriptional regulator MalT
MRALHQKGADWYISNGYPEKALKHYILGEEFEKAVHLFQERCISHLSHTNWANLRMDLELFPQGLRDKLPELRLAYAWTSTYEGEIFEMFSIVEDLRFEIWDLSSSTPALKAEWAVLEAYRAYNLVQDYQSCRELCEYALTHLPRDHTYALGYAWIFLGGSLQVLEGTPAAVERIQKGMQSGPDPLVISHQLMVLCYVEWMEGNIPMLQRSARELFALGDRTKNSEAIANALYFLGIAAYTTGDLQEAERILKDFFQRRYHTIAIIHFMGVTALIMCRANMGKEYLECEELNSLESFVHGQRHPFYLMFMEAFKTELIWRSGDLERAAERASEIANIPLTPLSNIYCPHLTRIKALISTGLKEGLDKAESEIQQIQNLLEATNNIRFRIDLDLLRAQLYFKRGKQDLEKKHLKSALKSASVYQIVSPFLEMDKEGYRRLGAICNASFPGLYRIQNSLRRFVETSEPVVLSPREKQVLALLGRHLSNKEIGNKLNISEKTVKRHTGNLFKKLGVSNRGEAASLVAEFNLS